jgi:hypothetical protein
MTKTDTKNINYKLNLQRGDLVEVRAVEDILQTLDEGGQLEGMPFMPEMLQFCGRQFRVYKRADKTCDTIENSGGRRLQNTVHLDSLRCSGMDHGGCQALCLLFWKEAWLSPVSANNRIGRIRRALVRLMNPAGTAVTHQSDRTSEQVLHAATFASSDQQDIRYSCQTTELLRASEPLNWWNPGQYLRDLFSGNTTLIKIIRTVIFKAYHRLIKSGVGYRALLGIYNSFQEFTGGMAYPYKQGVREDSTPIEALDLSPGDLVEVKSHDAILQTLDKGNKNRGMLFDVEMVRYCGKRYKVLRRVDRIINEQNGRMMNMKTPCIILDGVVCCAEFSEKRLFCPRSIYSYWREAWLKRVVQDDKGQISG